MYNVSYYKTLRSWHKSMPNFVLLVSKGLKNQGQKNFSKFGRSIFDFRKNVLCSLYEWRKIGYKQQKIFQKCQKVNLSSSNAFKKGWSNLLLRILFHQVLLVIILSK